MTCGYIHVYWKVHVRLISISVMYGFNFDVDSYNVKILFSRDPPVETLERPFPSFRRVPAFIVQTCLDTVQMSLVSHPRLQDMVQIYLDMHLIYLDIVLIYLDTVLQICLDTVLIYPDTVLT